MCELNGRFIKPCKGVLAILDQNKGVRLINLSDMKTFEPSSDRLILKTGDFRKNGVALNFCPFTGKDIATWLEPEPEAVA